jgi:hypothetical protein
MDIRQKIDASDIDGFDWNWLDKYGDEIAEELSEAFTTSFVSELPSLPNETVQDIASEWAREHSSDMVTKVAETSKTRMRQIVSDGVRRGESIGDITGKIRTDYLFSDEKARMIARTETAKALGQGQKGAAIAQGRDEKRWTTSGDVDDICLENESVGWIGISDVFPSGEDTVPAHPNCRCVVRYRTKELHSGLEGDAVTVGISEFRCKGCNALLGKNVHEGTRIKCRQCKSERVA